MKTLYLECAMGASGNMLLGALLDLLPDSEAWLERLNGLGIPGVCYRLERKSGAIAGNLVTVTVHGHDEDYDHPHHHGSGLQAILHQIGHLSVSAEVKAQAGAVYQSIAEAEAKVHQTTPSEVHFHEVGSLDAVADIVGVCLLLEALRADQVLASPVHVGSGTVRCAHGVLPVPAPATAELLRGIPSYTGDIPSELCTPTGAALLRQLSSGFGPMPRMRVERIGYGFGTKELERPNCLRAFLGETENRTDEVYEVRCNLDDMTGEELAFARERLEESGVLDVTVVAAMMKKNRPGFLLTCLCRERQLEETIRLLLAHTTTAGVRYTPWKRTILEPSFRTVETAYGPVREKHYGGTHKKKLEYEDLAKAAREGGTSLWEVRETCSKPIE